MNKPKIDPDRYLDGWANIILRNPICTKCNKKCEINEAKSLCCNANIKRVKEY